MCKNEKPVAMNNGSNQPIYKLIKKENQFVMTNYTRSTKKPQHDFRFDGMNLGCDECCVPLLLGGENYIESYRNGRANPLKCLCDTHAEEFGFGGVSE